MKKYTSTWPEWYSIIAAIMMIGFLLILTVSTFNLVLQELQDWRWREDYMKAYAGAEWALELALLQIKDNGYGYIESDSESQDLEYFGLGRKNGVMNYDIDSETSSYTWSLAAWAYSTDIIPLFTLDDADNKNSVRTLRFTDISSTGLIWNVIGATWGLSGTGTFTESRSGGVRTLWPSDSFDFQDVTISSLLLTDGNYLTIFNPTANQANYKVEVTGAGELFTKPKSTIYSTSKVGKYSQNLATTVDNSEFLGILKYSIYSWN